MSEAFIIFNGPPRCGKDLAKETLKSFYDNYSHNVTPIILTFSTVLQHSVPVLYAIDLDEWKERYESDLKDEPWDKLFGISQRQAVIELAENHLKRLHGPEVFTWIMNNLIENYRQQYDDKLLFLMDTGFDREFQSFVKNIGSDKCVYVRVDRPGKNFDNDSRSYISNQYLTDLKYIVRLENNGTEKQWGETVLESLLPIINKIL